MRRSKVAERLVRYSNRWGRVMGRSGRVRHKRPREVVRATITAGEREESIANRRISRMASRLMGGEIAGAEMDVNWFDGVNVDVDAEE